jgi:pimeloyl-ACP methyl ester carboxylesterase
MTPEFSISRHPAPEPRAQKKLLVMLPGAGMAAQDFAAHGMVSLAQDHDPGVDIIAARLTLDLYLDDQAGAALHRVIIEPALAQGYAQIWLLGISLGGMGALLYAALHQNLVDGIVLLAPFLGTPGTIAGIEAAGGLPHWTPNAATTTPETRMLTWLRDFIARAPPSPNLFLGFGEADRFARGHRLLAARLPPARVVTRPGGHDWETWAALWRRLLDAGALATPDATQAPVS